METSSLFLKDPSAVTLVAGDLEAVFLPGYGMLGASLRHRHIEILRRVQDLEVAAAKGSTAGIPLLHPWANRLAGPASPPSRGPSPAQPGAVPASTGCAPVAIV
jgi:hypothetical protein